MTFFNRTSAYRSGVFAAFLLSTGLLIGRASSADPQQDAGMEYGPSEATSRSPGWLPQTPPTFPPFLEVHRDLSYGRDDRQRFDVYSPIQTESAPVIFMVHGGGWRHGSKSERNTFENKVARWVPKGFVFISTDYRVLPEADPMEQARDVARALAAAQEGAESWGGDRSKFILMGHSAGAHLVSLLATEPSISSGIVTTPWLGTVALDSSAYDVVDIMENRHPALFDNAFGNDPEYWKSLSPAHSLSSTTRPILCVCSNRNAFFCRQARKFTAKAAALGVRSRVLEKDYSHMEANRQLGVDRRYTAAVENFMAGLDQEVAKRLGRRSRDTP